MIKTVSVQRAKKNFASLLAQLEADGQPILICRNGKPVAELIPHKQVIRAKTHPVLSKIKIDYDPTEPAGNDEWPKSVR